MAPVRSRCRAALLSVLTLLSLAAPAHASPAAQSVAQSISLGILKSALATYAGGYNNGFWNSPNTICWSCNEGGPASATATLYILTGRTQPQLLQQAEATIDTAISTRQRPSGAFVPPPGDTQPTDIATMFFADEEANAYLALAPVLDSVRRARWQASIAAAASYLAPESHSWYVNGNINLGETELMYLAWRITGKPAFSSDYSQAWTFTLSPPSAAWPGRGLVLVRAPTRADWSDGAGYLTETGAGGTGFDAEYTSLQLDVAARLYLLSGDPRALRLANVLVNMILPRMSSGFWLDTSGGTRHTEPDRQVPLLSSAFAVLGLDGGRTDLAADIAPELGEEQATILAPWNTYGEVYRRGLGSDVSVSALASALARPVGWAAAATAAAPVPSPPAQRGALAGHAARRATRQHAHHRRWHRGWYSRRSVQRHR